MTPERKEDIRNRLAYARSAHPRNALPDFGNLKAMEELLAALNEVEGYAANYREERDALENRVEELEEALAEEAPGRGV